MTHIYEILAEGERLTSQEGQVTIRRGHLGGTLEFHFRWGIYTGGFELTLKELECASFSFTEQMYHAAIRNLKERVNADTSRKP